MAMRTAKNKFSQIIINYEAETAEDDERANNQINKPIRLKAYEIIRIEGKSGVTKSGDAVKNTVVNGNAGRVQLNKAKVEQKGANQLDSQSDADDRF